MGSPYMEAYLISQMSVLANRVTAVESTTTPGSLTSPVISGDGAPTESGYFTGQIYNDNLTGTLYYWNGASWQLTQGATSTAAVAYILSHIQGTITPEGNVFGYIAYQPYHQYDSNGDVIATWQFQGTLNTKTGWVSL